MSDNGGTVRYNGESLGESAAFRNGELSSGDTLSVSVDHEEQLITWTKLREHGDPATHQVTLPAELVGSALYPIVCSGPGLKVRIRMDAPIPRWSNGLDP